MDAATVTLLAAITAAVASIAGLILRSRTELRAELRQTNRKKLEAFVDELGDAMHKLIACSVLRSRDLDRTNVRYWDSKIADARTVLRNIRPKVRYQLWGIDDGLRALIALPDWLNTNSAANASNLLSAAHNLRVKLDQSIRLCYRHGRTPSLVERWRVTRAVTHIRRIANKSDSDGDATEALDLKQVVYPKHYAVVQEVIGEEFVAELGNGQTVRVRQVNRSGKGSRSKLSAGARVKIYRRDGEDFFRYRFLGG